MMSKGQEINAKIRELTRKMGQARLQELPALDEEMQPLLQQWGEELKRSSRILQRKAERSSTPPHP